MESNTLRVACIQLRTSDVVRNNIDVASQLIREAASQGAKFVATPEMTSLLDRRPGALFAKSKTEDQDEALSAFRALATELRIHLLIGSLPIRVAPDKCANRSVLISPNGDIVARYDKIHMFDVMLSDTEAYAESTNYRPGNQAVLAKIPGANIGLTVCYDLRFPHLYRTLATAGADILAVPSSFTKTTGEAHWHVLLRARAIENGCFVIAPAQGGAHADGRETYGHSLIVDPWGKILAEAGTEPEVIYATLDMKQVAEVRKRIPSLKHDRPFVEPMK